jgi:ribonuclease Z
LFEIIFLGTSASAPSIQRGLPAQIIKRDEFRFLLDCGEGTQRQILQSGIGFKNLTNILITHGHLDHILGLGGLISTLVRWETLPKIDIYGGEHTLERIRELLFGVVLKGGRPDMAINLKPVTEGVIFSGDDFKIHAVPVFHRGSDSYGYIFQEDERRPFLPQLADELDIPPGPWRRDLVDGKPAKLPDGRLIEPDMVLGPVKPGLRLACIGDTGNTERLVKYVRGADLLIIEATYLESEADMARRYSHITAREAAELARQAGVKRLILSHLSRRYRDKDILKEARAVFPETSLAHDMDVVQVKRQEE